MLSLKFRGRILRLIKIIFVFVFVFVIYSWRSSEVRPSEYVPDGKVTLSDRVTLVTAFMDIGEFRKGPKIRTSQHYKLWTSPFSRLSNPVVGYFDTDDFVRYFSQIRESKVTKVEKVYHKDMWAFGLRTNISTIFAQRGYPRHNPDTTNPEYVIATFSRYDFVYRTSLENPFKTK